MLMTNNSSIQEVLFFPQMKPEQKAAVLSEEEKIIFDLLKSENPVFLGVLKEKSGLSNKKWDTSIKGLTKSNLAKVFKNEEGLFVTLV
jgi:lysyl-tRNA synthetase class 2